MASEFSEAPTSEASIARLKYDGKIITPLPPPSNAATPAPATAKDFDGNEAGSVGSSDEGTKTPIKGAATLGAVAATPSSSSSATFPSSTIQPKLFIPISTDKLIVGSVIFLGLMAFTSFNDEDTEAGGAVAVSGVSSSPPEPYGMAGGRNYFDDAGDKGLLNMNAAKTSGMVSNSQNPPPSPTADVVEQQPKKKVVLTAEEWSQVVKPKEKPKWKLEKPIPYGIQNSGKNPFIAEVLEYCVGGKVTEDCVDSLKGYLDNISETGAAATNEEVTAVVGYINSLGSSSSTTSSSTIVEKRKAGLAFANYLDALSAGSAPPPSSAKAVKTYLDTLNGTAGAAFSARMKRERLDPLPPTIATVGRTPDPFDAVVVTNSPDFAQYNTRLSSIEVRVSSLETKVDELPDRVFDKIEAWQSRQEGRMADKVRKIVNALSSVSSPVVASSNPAPKDADSAKLTSPVVITPASPLGSAIPERFGVPRASSVSVGSRKSSYKFGGESTWKQATTEGNPNASVTPLVAPVTQTIQATPTAPTATHESVKDVRSSVPKKYGVSGGTGWKSSKPKAGGGGYLDNINR
jgi:hypothetical protein